MHSCCSHSSASESTGKFFSKRSKWYARSFRKGALEKNQTYLLDGIRSEPVAEKTILDIGSGVGALHLTLLKEGAAQATGIDMSEEMLKHAKKFAITLGVEKNVSYVLGDFMTHADSIANADITILDKVICCYEDYEGLIKTSAAKTKLLYAVSLPKNNLLMEFLFKFQIAIAKLFRSGFRPYWHNWNTIHQLITAQGFTLVYSNTTILWQAAVFKRKV